MTIQSYVTNLCKHSGIDQSQVEVSVDEAEDQVTVNINLPQEESGLFIGFHGETLSSLQRLIRIIFQKEHGDKKIVLNINNYREQRVEKLQEMAENVARRVLESGRPYTFAYLPPNERFVIHTTISENPDFASLESVSQGEGAHRYLMIRLKDSN